MIKGNKLQISLLIYFVFVGVLIFLNPYFIYDNKGKIKLFGINKNKTLFPMWFLIFVIAIFSYYLAVLLVNI